jgi:hypothetical protein
LFQRSASGVWVRTCLGRLRSFGSHPPLEGVVRFLMTYREMGCALVFVFFGFPHWGAGQFRRGDSRGYWPGPYKKELQPTLAALGQPKRFKSGLWHLFLPLFILGKTFPRRAVPPVGCPAVLPPKARLLIVTTRLPNDLLQLNSFLPPVLSSHSLLPLFNPNTPPHHNFPLPRPWVSTRSPNDMSTNDLDFNVVASTVPTASSPTAS